MEGTLAPPGSHFEIEMQETKSNSVNPQFAIRNPKLRCRLLLVGTVGIVAAALYIFPPFHIVSLEKTKRKIENERFNPKEFVERFWNDRLLKSLDQTVQAGTLLPAIKQDPQSAKRQYGRQLGLSNTYYYFVSGQARVVTIKPETIALTLSGAGSKPDLVLVVANLSGNAVRDGTGLLNVNEFPNSQEFNQISAELNRRIETSVLPEFRHKVFVGATVAFAGCAEIEDEGSDLQPLRLIPIHVQIQ